MFVEGNSYTQGGEYVVFMLTVQDLLDMQNSKHEQLRADYDRLQREFGKLQDSAQEAIGNLILSCSH